MRHRWKSYYCNDKSEEGAVGEVASLLETESTRKGIVDGQKSHVQEKHSAGRYKWFCLEETVTCIKSGEPKCVGEGLVATFLNQHQGWEWDMIGNHALLAW